MWKDPAGNNYVFDEDAVIEYAKKSKKKSHLLLSLIIFNLIADSRLPEKFSVEQLIQILTSHSIVEHRGTVLDAYLNVYRIKDHDFGDEIAEIETIFAAKSSVKEIEKLIDLLESAVLIIEDKDQYTFDFVTLAGLKDTILKQEEDVLDTRFSSGLRPFSTLGRPDKTSDLENFYPNDLIETANDILFPWIARMMIMADINMGSMPFKTIYFHGIVNDEKGRKMSKSLGNATDPLEIIEKFGADALRCSLMMGSTPGNPVNFSEQKADYYYRFANKLRNAVRFVYTKISEENGDNVQLDLDAIKEDIEKHMEKLNHFDKRMIGKVNMVIEESGRMFADYHL